MPRVLCDKAVELLADLPPYLSGDLLVQGLVQAQAMEFARIDAAAAAVRDGLIPVEASDVLLLNGRWLAGLLSMWESLLGLPVRPAGASTSERRAKVLAYIQKRNSGAGSDWVALLTLALGAISWSYEEGPGDYEVTIRLPLGSSGYTVAQVEALARAITPAHLSLNIVNEDRFLVGITGLGSSL